MLNYTKIKSAIPQSLSREPAVAFATQKNKSSVKIAAT
jgi:hypothetical protein